MLNSITKNVSIMAIEKVTILQMLILRQLSNNFNQPFPQVLSKFEYLLEQRSLSPKEILKEYSKNPEYLNTLGQVQ